MLITFMISLAAVNQGLFSVSPIQLMSKCAGAGRERSQTDSQTGQWKFSIPWTSCSVSERGLANGGKWLSAFWFSGSLNLLSFWNLNFSRSSNFSRILDFWVNCKKFAKSQVVHDHCSSTSCRFVIGCWEKFYCI